MSTSYDYRKIWVTEAEVDDMLENIGYAITVLNDDELGYSQAAIDGLKHAREIGNAIKIDMTEEEDEK